MKKYIFYIMILAGLIISSCDKKEEFEQIDSNVVEAAGEWWIQFSADDYETGYLKVLTYNTAENTENEIWISDKGNWKGILCKCQLDLSALTFSSNNVENQSGNNTITIKNGKIEKDAGLSTSGLVTDKISFEIEMSDEPGVTYHAVGTRKTGYIEDEH